MRVYQLGERAVAAEGGANGGDGVRGEGSGRVSGTVRGRLDHQIHNTPNRCSHPPPPDQTVMSDSVQQQRLIGRLPETSTGLIAEADKSERPPRLRSG
jgi:hypothetical protein